MQNTITLAGETVAPLREGLYALLGSTADTLRLAAGRGDAKGAEDACDELRTAASLLALAGWRAPARSVSVPAELVRIAQRALTMHLEAEKDFAREVVDTAEARKPIAATERALLVLESAQAAPVDPANPRGLDVLVCGCCGGPGPEFVWAHDRTETPTAYCAGCAERHGWIAHGEATAALRALGQTVALAKYAGLTDGEIGHGLQLAFAGTDDPLDTPTAAVVGSDRREDEAWRRFFRPARIAVAA